MTPSESVVLERPPHLAGAGYAKCRRQRVYIFTSRYGLLFALLLMVMLLGAVNYNNSMAYVLVFLLGSLFMMCMLHTCKNLRGLVLSTAVPTPVFAGEAACFPVLLDNRAGPVRVGLEIASCPQGTRPKRRTVTESGPLFVDLDAAQFARHTLSIPTTRRGRLALGRLRIRSTYPLGLFCAWSYLSSVRQCLVYPAPAGTPALPQPAVSDLAEQSGDKTGTDDFVGFREYRPGDSIRNIDWKAVARERGLLLKRFSGGGSRRLLLCWEQTGHLHDVERRLSQLCLWALEAEAQGYYYGLVLPEVSLAPDLGHAHMHHCLEKLATYGLADS